MYNSKRTRCFIEIPVAQLGEAEKLNKLKRKHSQLKTVHFIDFNRVITGFVVPSHPLFIYFVDALNILIISHKNTVCVTVPVY